MTFPPGEWSPLLIGDQWPDDQDLVTLSDAKLNRGAIKTAHLQFADTLRNAQNGPLSLQQGHTADDLRNAFSRGESQARQVAGKNGVKENAYGTAYDSMVSLQHDLTGLAEEGNKQIKDIQDSKQPLEAKVTMIVAAIHQCRTLASLSAAKYSSNVFDAMQRILDEEGVGQSARQFTQTHGRDLDRMFRQPENGSDLEERVSSMVSQTDLPTHNTGGELPNGPNPTPTHPTESAPAQLGESGGKAPSTQTDPAGLGGGSPPLQFGASGGKTPAEQALPPAAVIGSPPPQLGIAGGKTPPQLNTGVTPAPIIPGPVPSPVTAAPSGPAPSLAGGGTPGLQAATQLPMTPFAGAPFAPPSPAQGLSPGELIHSFDKGMQAGAPFSAAAEAVAPPAAMTPTQPQTPPTALSGLNAPVHAPLFDSSPVTQSPAPDATAPPSVVAAPAAPAGQVAATAAPPAGPLPAYASDLRPAITATTPAAPPSPPPSTTPASAQVHPSAGQGSTSQPAVVRRATSPAPQSSPSTLGTEAVAATATGAVAGAASADATARVRLQGLVAAVARQQPRLAWAAGDRPDNTTILTTDLASGWIPPGIEIPAAVTLLPPERRRGDLETLLGEVKVTAAYTPIHHIPEEDEPVPTSPRPRRVPDIDELGWELGQATQWRDGLPRLAHTLAKAGSSGTGVLNSEVELLHEHLAGISARVLDKYPGQVDSHDVGNWQLLAAIDALVAGDKYTATYHLAWFQACAN